MSAEPGETAAWTEQDEHEMLRYGVGTIPPFRTTGAHQDNAVRFAREILRLRAENERLQQGVLEYSERAMHAEMNLRDARERLAKAFPGEEWMVLNIAADARIAASRERLAASRARGSEYLRGWNECLDWQEQCERDLAAAATRERETPPDGDGDGVPRFENGDPLDEAMYAEWKASRSRVSDNG